MKRCELCNLDPETNPTVIERFDHWTVLISYKQPTLGSSLVVLNRHEEGGVSFLRDEEALGYVEASRRLESALRRSFQPDAINHLMLALKVPHLHYHVVPRYKTEREAAGRVWEPNYEGMPVLGTPIQDKKTLDEIKRMVSPI